MSMIDGYNDEYYNKAVKAPTIKQIAIEIYNQLKDNTELQKEVNNLLRKDKLKKIKNGK